MTAERLAGLPIEAYLDTEAEHATGLRAMNISPLHYRWDELNGRPDSDTLRAGRAVHSAVFEPEKFLSDYVAWTKTTKTGASSPRNGGEWEAFKAEHAGKTILTRHQHETAVAVADAVMAYPRAAALLRDAAGEAELTIRWVHERTGLPCKARLDWFSPTVIGELKSTRDPSPRAFGATFARLGYTLQAAFYADAVRAVGLEPPPVKVIAVSATEPHDVVVYGVPDDILAIGRDQYERALDQVVACRASGVWPGLARDEELELKLPVWALPDNDWEVGVAVAERTFFGEGA